ncbi:hypothetical protein FQZ97_865630 [compost metagenome]
MRSNLVTLKSAQMAFFISADSFDFRESKNFFRSRGKSKDVMIGRLLCSDAFKTIDHCLPFLECVVGVDGIRPGYGILGAYFYCLP